MRRSQPKPKKSAGLKAAATNARVIRDAAMMPGTKPRRGDKAGLMLIGGGHADIECRKNCENEGLDHCHKQVQSHECDR
jgi:hypothetical protein